MGIPTDDLDISGPSTSSPSALIIGAEFRAGQALVLARQKAWWLVVEGGGKSPGQPGFRFVRSKNAARTVEFHRDVKHLSRVQDYLLNVLKGDILRVMATPDLFRHDRNVDNAKPLEGLSDTRRDVVQ
ncbi:hypothetical protein [Mesorhizobium sp. M4B.F.Ca.ET.089.01.1.1]|uniref:hypothetical protein n=1 Tax=Mesorhizobium sp. M4B.F.Ca.ET.089.01.1.1 TaxID=2496662 RepID=UPI00167B3A36|nr:hypothetical protein [Mesorhizobium sp. M4B.F.Ca.ET.089.01.1.1]